MALVSSLGLQTLTGVLFEACSRYRFDFPEVLSHGPKRQAANASWTSPEFLALKFGRPRSDTFLKLRWFSEFLLGNLLFGWDEGLHQLPKGPTQCRSLSPQQPWQSRLMWSYRGLGPDVQRSSDPGAGSQHGVSRG